MSMENILESDKYPSTFDKHVGVEIEFVLNSNHETKLSKLLIAEGLQYNVSVTDDGSVRDVNYVPRYEMRTYTRGDGSMGTFSQQINYRDSYGKEIRIIAKESQVQDIVRKVCRILHSLDAEVNRTCGLHVHIDMRKRDKEQVVKNFFNCQNLLYSLVDKARKKNKYCRMLRKPDSRVTGRRYGINKLSLDKHGTLELRMHEGTLKPSKINNWIQLLIGIADAEITSPVNKIDKLKVNEKVKAFYKKVKCG